MPASLHPNQATTTNASTSSMQRLRLELTDDEGKPLLANLSPEATLQALRSTNTALPDHGKEALFLQSSVEAASDSEREWGIRAAIAAKKIRDWLNELQAWPWMSPDRPENRGFEARWDIRQVQGYLNRIDDIKEHMRALDVESLKDHVRQVHAKNFASSLDYEKLEDFTAIITATLVQALPPLLHLDSLLKAWAIRLRVLQDVPAFLQKLKNCQNAMNKARTAIDREENEGGTSRRDFSKDTLRQMKTAIEDSVQHLGRSIDKMLDQLEGTHDRLPDSWIDAVDQLEVDYSSWVVQAEAVAAGNEFQQSFQKETEDPSDYFSQPTSDSVGQVDGSNDPQLAAPFEQTFPNTKSSLDQSNTSTSSDANSDVSRRSSVSSGRSSPEIMSALIATNPGSPVKVTTPVRQTFQNASIQRYGSVKSKDIRRLLVRRSDSCPSSIPLVDLDLMRRQSVGGTSLASVQPESELPEPAGAGHAIPKTSQEKNVEPAPPRTPSPTKSKTLVDHHEDSAAGSSPITVTKQRQPNMPTTKQLNGAVNSFKHKDKLEARISTILNNIPADIRLKSSDTAVPPPPPTNPTRPKTPLRRSITPSLLRHKAPPTHTPPPSSTPSLTLAPASAPGPKGQDRSSIHEPEIKLYHLQQTNDVAATGGGAGGKESTPVKLYVRLVGPEGERVMVRVGGGWADLGEYLKEYALHHGASASASTTTSGGKGVKKNPYYNNNGNNGNGSGHRSVSDFHIQNLPTPGSGSTIATGGYNNHSGNRPMPKTAPSTRTSSRNGGLFVGGGDGASVFEQEYAPPSPSPSPSPALALASAPGKGRAAGMMMKGGKGGKEKEKEKEKEKLTFGWLGKVGSSNRVFLKRRATLENGGA